MRSHQCRRLRFPGTSVYLVSINQRKPPMRLALSLLLAIATSAAAQSPVTGDWHGTLDVGATQLHLVLHVTAAPDSTLHATMDSVEQQADGIPVTTITFTENK